MTHMRRLKLLLLGIAVLLPLSLAAQDDITIKLSGDAASRTRLAAASFKPVAISPKTEPLRRTFDTVLFADLSNAGIFDMVSKSMAPAVTPGGPAEISLPQWSGAPVAAQMVAFGSLGVTDNRISVNGFLFDVKNPQYPQVLAKQYSEDATEDQARQIAHRFADEIISKLGGGIPGIAETKIYYVHQESKTIKEIWEMDYDGANQHAVTNLGTISISPRVSPDNSRLAFTSLGDDGFKIRMYSLLLGKMIAFPTSAGFNESPAWSPNGMELAYSAAPNNDAEIYTASASGGGAHRITSFVGPDVSPVYNPRSGAQIAWISGRTGLPQLYIMDSDGSGVTLMTDGGYVSSPSWSPNGQFLAFAWNRKYGPGAPGGQDIYVMEIATKHWIQLTHATGHCDFPSWSPDGRHIVYTSSPNDRVESTRIMTMLADGTQQHPLTGTGSDMPNWSWK